MIASVEKPDGSYVDLEMGDPVCGRDFCDGCGDCLHCQWHGEEDWCSAGESWWVIYADNPLNPFTATANNESAPTTGNSVATRIQDSLDSNVRLRGKRS